MKNVLKFMGFIFCLLVWTGLIHMSIHFINQSDIRILCIGIITLTFWVVSPVILFRSNILMFLKNMKGVFFDKEIKK
jgi:hypothetical protein